MTPVLNLERCPNQLSNFGELSKSALQIWLPSDFWQTTDRLMTDSQHKPDWLPTDSYSLQIQLLFVGLDTSSQFGEVSKSALQFWRDYWETPDWLIPDWLQTFNRLTLNPTDSKKFVVNDTRSKSGELSKSALQIWLTSYSWQTPGRLLTDSWQTPDRLLTDSWLTPDRLRTYSWLTHISINSH